MTIKNKSKISKSKNKKSIRKSKKIKKSNRLLLKKKMNNVPRNQFKSNREYLLHKCGLPDIEETSHCFNDSTHHSCCEISEKARDYADSSGNPIGKLAEDVFNKLPDNHPKKKYFLNNNKRPWCTCFGSKVCGYYSDEVDSNTNISFISSPYLDSATNKLRFAEFSPNTTSEACEEYARNKFNVRGHGTPGIKQNNNSNLNCKNKNKINFKLV